MTNTRDNPLGKISSVSATGFGTLVSGLSYKPFGGPVGLTNGFGGTVNNQAGECDCVMVSNLNQPRERWYGYDYNRNLTSITGTTTPQYNQIFTYDELNRLINATGRYGTLSYTYDDVGNRITRNTNGVVENYTYYTGTNSLYQVTGGQDPRTFSYDANGNPTSDGTLTFIYDQQNQLKEVKEGANTIVTYTYNGLGQRVKKAVVGGATTIYHYDLDGKLIAESTSTGTFTKEYLYMGKVRIAMVEIGPGGSSIYHYLNDRLGTPEILTDASGTVRWEAWYEPFGEAHVHPSSSVVNNLRLPGQHFDSETGFHYNYFRYYDSRTGKYITPDPIGLAAGMNLYSYVGSNPLNSIDPWGLEEIRKRAYLVYSAAVGGGFGGYGEYGRFSLVFFDENCEWKAFDYGYFAFGGGFVLGGAFQPEVGLAHGSTNPQDWTGWGHVITGDIMPTVIGAGGQHAWSGDNSMTTIGPHIGSPGGSIAYAATYTWFLRERRVKGGSPISGR